jgi:outer membrane protein TolC
MNKKLFILMFLILTAGALSVQADTDESPFRDIYVQELPPHIETTAPSENVKAEKTSLFDRFKKPKAAKEVEVVKPDKKALKKTEKQSKKPLKLFEKKQETAAKTLNNDAEELPAAVENTAVETKDLTEIPAVHRDDSTVITDTSYNAAVNVDKIVEVDECVKIALEHHPAIQSAMSNADVYKSRIAQAWANYFPTFSAGISYSRNNAQDITTHAPVQNYDLYYVPSIAGNMLLFDFGKTKAQADIAKRSYESAKYSLENTINSVIFLVKQSYYNLLFAQQQVRVYEETVRDYELHLEQAKAYYEIGTKAKIDVLTAESNLGKAKLGLIQANNTLKVAYVQLSNAMGMPEFKDYNVIDNLKMKSYDIGVDDAVNTAYDTSPELLAAKKRADASEVLVRATKRAFTPDLSGFAGYSRGGRHINTDDGYQIGAQLSYSTVNLLLLKKQVDEAKATYKKELADYENIKQNIYYEVNQAYLNLVAAQESITVAKLSMDQAKEQYDQASGRYKVGLGDAIELKDAETTYRNSQLDYYNTLLNYHVSAANLEKLMGSPLKATDTDLL